MTTIPELFTGIDHGSDETSAVALINPPAAWVDVLVKAAALILAEIERLDRARAQQANEARNG